MCDASRDHNWIFVLLILFSVCTAREQVDPIELMNWSPNFVTECFFMTLSALHLGFMRVIKYDVEELRPRWGRRLHTLRENQRDHPGDSGIFASEKEAIYTMIAEQHCLSGALLERSLVRQIARFYEWTCAWLMHKFNSKNPQDRQLLRLLPEHVLEDIVQFFDFLRTCGWDTCMLTQSEG
jgi:hypothetical protein